MDPHGVVDRLSAQGLDTKRLQRLHEVSKNCLSPPDKARREAAPERPAGAFEHSLARHVVLPLTRAVEAVAVALDREAASFVAFNDEVDAVAAAGHLRLDAEAALDQFVEHLELEARLALLAQGLHRAARLAGTVA